LREEEEKEGVFVCMLKEAVHNIKRFQDSFSL